MTDRVVVLERLAIDGRLVDELPLRRYVEGVFSSFAAVEAWLAARPGDELRQWPRAFRCYVARELATNAPDREDLGCRSYGLDGTLWGDTPAWHGQWRGRPPEACRFQLGEIVGLIWCGQFRWGVVGLLPASPAYVAALTYELFPDDDVYAVYFADGGHTHPPECDLLRAPRPVPRQTRTALLAKWRRLQEPMPDV